MGCGFDSLTKIATSGGGVDPSTLVPYSGATQDVLLGANYISASGVKFNTTSPMTLTEAGDLAWNGDIYAIEYSNGLGTIKVGQDIYILYYNDTGVDIQPFRGLHLKGAFDVGGGFLVPTPDLTDSRYWERLQGTLSISCCLIPNGELGLAFRFGSVVGGDLSHVSAGAQLWFGEDGLTTDTKPEFPKWAMSVGGSFNNLPAPNGKILISMTSSIYDTFADAWIGTIRESFDFLITSDGSTITGTLKNSDPTLNLTCIFNNFYTLDTTTAPLTIELNQGSPTVAQEQYIYISETTKALTISNTSFPENETYCLIAQCSVYDAARTKQEGAKRNQNINNHLKQTGNNGHVVHSGQALREKLPATYKSGCKTTVAIGPSNELWPSTSEGVAMQAHDQNIQILDVAQYSIDAVTASTFVISDDGDLTSIFPDSRWIQMNNSTGNDGIYRVASTNYSDPDFTITVEETIPDLTVDGTIGDSISVTNDFTTQNVPVLDLATITTDASGGSLTNKSYTVVVSIIANKGTEKPQLLANFPTGTYSKTAPADAEKDLNRYAVYQQPADTKGVLIFSSAVNIVDNSGVKSIYSIVDKTETNILFGGGGSAGATTYLQLTDTDPTFTGNAHKIPEVNAGETDLVFTDSPVLANLTVTGTLDVETLVQSQTVQVSDNLLETRYDAVAGLGAGVYTGIQAHLYDGVNDGQIVINNAGTARVGDIGNTVALAGREDTPNDGQFAIWNNATSIFDTTTIASSNLTDSSNIAYLDQANPFTNMQTIESSSPGEKTFRVKNTLGNDIFSLWNDGSSNSQLYMNDSTGALKNKLDSGGDSYFTGGNVGINKTSPSEKLEVVGNVLISGSINGVQYHGSKTTAQMWALTGMAESDKCWNSTVSKEFRFDGSKWLAEGMVRLTHRSVTAVTAGEVVIVDSGNANSVILNTVDNNIEALLPVFEGGSQNDEIVIYGSISEYDCSTAVSIGNYIQPSGTAGKWKAQGSIAPSARARALTAVGVSGIVRGIKITGENF
jgi:hypothetical protein